MKPLLEALCDKKVTSAKHWLELRDSFLPEGRLPPGSNEADWTFQFISNKLFMILYTYFGQDPRKVVSLAQNCGIESYRLINIEYDPVTAGMELALAYGYCCRQVHLQERR